MSGEAHPVDLLIARVRAGELGAAELLDSGMPVHAALSILVEGEWMGADQDPVTIAGASPAAVAGGLSAQCVCGCMFTFQPGSQRARCPGCGARYQTQGR